MLVSMKENNIKLAKGLLKRHKIQQILQYWRKNPKKWIQSRDLRSELVKKYQDVISRKDGTFIDPKTKEEYKEKPKTLYNNDSELYRDLKDMVSSGLLEHKEVSQKKGKPKSFYRLSIKHTSEPLKIWHKDCIMNTSINNPIPTNNDLLFYFPNNAINIGNFSFIKEDIEKINILSKEIIEILDKIKDIFIESGKRKAVNICKNVIEGFDMDDAFKEYFYICLIADFATDLHLNGYDFSQIEENSKEKFMRSEPSASIYKIIISAAEQFIKNKYSLTKKDFRQFLEDSDNNRNLHSFIGEIIRDFMMTHSSYVIISESPSLFMGNEKPLFSKKNITQFNSCHNIHELDKLALKIKNEKYLTPFEPMIKFSKIEPFLAEKQKQTDIVHYISQILQKNIIKTTDNNKQPIFKGELSFFDDLTFLDEFEDTLGGYGFKKDEVCNDLKNWAGLFSL